VLAHHDAPQTGVLFDQTLQRRLHELAPRLLARANDNLSGVAALVALAELLRERPIPGMRVLLVSRGAEETLQDGVRAFMARHRDELDAERTWFVASIQHQGPEPVAGG
jgi:hypothetical protein